MAASLSITTAHAVATASRKVMIHHSPNDVLASTSSQKLRRRRGFPLLLAESPLFNSRQRCLINPSAVSSSSGAETSAVTEGTTDLLESVLVYDLNGNEVPISDLWKDRKALVAFARHFGCVLCRTRAAYLAAEKDKMDAAGVALVLIEPGSVDQAKAFSEQTKFKGGRRSLSFWMRTSINRRGGDGSVAALFRLRYRILDNLLSSCDRA